MNALVTVPHAPVERVNFDGTIEPMPIGSFVNAAAARAIYIRDATVLCIELPAALWKFACPDEETAQKLARDFAIRAGR